MKKISLRFTHVLIASLAILAAAGVYLIVMYASSDELRDAPVIEPPEPFISLQEEGSADEPPAVPIIMDRFLDLYEQNDDLVGWIRVPDTAIDYPVVYCSDNAFYLKHDFEKNPSNDGIPFLDMGAGLLENNQSLALYGHYLKSGKMFTALHKYKEIEYYKKYPLFEFDTLYEEGFYKIFSVFYMAGNQSDELFYYYPISNFSSDEAFMNHVNQLLARSIFITTVDVMPGDQLVLMTCCTYETDNLRLIIAGRKIRSEEPFEIDTENVRINPQPLFPQKWYDKKGGSPPPLPEF